MSFKHTAVAGLVALLPVIGQADKAAGEKKAQFCLICHKPDNPSNVLPTLDGQPREYLYNQIKAFKDKRRSFPIMQSNVGSLSEEDINDIVDYFASRPVVRGAYRLDTTKITNGKLKADEFDCAECHMVDFAGRQEVPRLAGMDPIYVTEQIASFTEDKRAHPRIDSRTGISYDDAQNLAQYFAQLE